MTTNEIKKRVEGYKEFWPNPLIYNEGHCENIEWLCSSFLKMYEALEKISDPRKRDHKEPDAYTQLGCVMHIAETTLSEIGDNDGI